MRDRALEIVASRPAAADGTNLLREYVQSRILGQMQEAGAFVPLAFMGGTSLRFLFRIPRFSEDLDFTVVHGDGFDLRRLAGRLETALTREGYRLTVKVDDEGTVGKAWIGFAGLTADAGLSPHHDQVLWVKLEVDNDPPAGARLKVSTINIFGLLRLQHHDLPSLFAGKLAAVFARGYVKGRDVYDLMWFLSRSPSVEPNATLLHAALEQTAPQIADAAAADWRSAARQRLGTLDWTEVRRDVAPFVEQSRDVELLDAATFDELLSGTGNT